MGGARGAPDVDADGRLRPRRPARRGSDGHARAVPVRRVTLYHAPGCSLCDRAREQLLRVREQEPFELVEVDIAGDPELEAAYREWLPVVEIDGERAFVYHVFEAPLLARLRAALP